MHGEERSWWVVLAVTSAIMYRGFLAWKSQRRWWLCAAGAALIVQLIFLRLPAGSAIVFGGDAGAPVLGTVLMATFCAPRESAIRRDRRRQLL
jgi:UDP-N-acetylmuramyl pentapeptide phosphotransferase/UDP-N-acetylglucosamine-1-phosphate transferase